MKLLVRKSTLRGAVRIPGSKSHTIRAVAIAAMARGESRIREPLYSRDADAAVWAYRALGIHIEQDGAVWRVRGAGGEFRAPNGEIDVANSGTTLNIVMGSCALLRQGKAVLTGDEQIQRRPSGPLAASLTELGARAVSLRANGCAPFEVSGRLRGGMTSIEAPNSQFVTSLLMAAPLADGASIIRVPLLHEKPYVTMTLDWLKRQGVHVDCTPDYAEFRIAGGQEYIPVDRAIPADFSSGTFFLAAGALGENDIICQGLDMNDTQGDKAVVDFLRQMGARISIASDEIRVAANGLHGCELDLNATPDALPMMAVLACFAEGETRLVNVPQARIKETDRIAVMREELARLGADVTELKDGLVIRESRLRGTTVNGHGDHRVVMALAIAGTQTEGETIIEGAEAAGVTYPGFVDSLRALDARVELAE